MRKPHGLTKEQDELRLQGLRILARWIVRAHLASLSADSGERNGSGCEDGRGRPSTPEGEAPWTEGAHGR